ncbi:FK506-binding protein 5-like [Salvia hispanica]|uniref:FK506-binding protein 5-like n=1 Tax=Salvia hispanica TaxID=49212 RepID=UPI002009A73D|nr:FK506-binding protein 5-like [Salvia hispanica]
MQRNQMPRSARGKNKPKEKVKGASTEATSSNPATEKPPSPLPEESPAPTPAEVQPQSDISQSNPITEITPTEAASDDDDLDPEEVIQEFMKKYGKRPKASKFFAKMSEACRKQEEVIPALTPLTIPPRPQTLIETPTAQALPTHPENPQILPETLTQETNPPNTIPQTETEPHVEPSINEEEIVEEEGDKMDTEESERDEEGDERVEQEEILEVDTTRSGDEGETGEGVDGEEGVKAGEDKEEETEDVEKAVDGEKGSEGSGDRRGEEGENVGEEIVEKETEKEEETNEEVGGKEGKKDGDREETGDVREEIETEIVVVDDTTTDDQGTPTDERLTRRQSRRNRKQEDEAEAGRAKSLRLEDIEETGDDIPQVQETLPAEKDISPEALETRYEAERKRKGKHAAKPQKKKSRPTSTTVVINEPEAIRVPFAHSTEEEKEQEEAQEETGIPTVEESPFETMEVLVIKKLLKAMVQFEDPKLQQACDGRAANGKSAKSGKKLCLSDLRDLGVEKKFISYFKSIGFEWLLNHCEEKVPVALAKEFFTSFKFKATTDLDADAISF